MDKALSLTYVYLIIFSVVIFGLTAHFYYSEKEIIENFNNYCVENNYDGLANKYIRDNIEYIRITNKVLVELKNKLYVPCYEHTLINGTIKTEYKLIYWSDKNGN